MLNFVEIEKLFHLQEAKCSCNKTQVSLYYPTKLAIQSILRLEEDLVSNCGQYFETKNISFDDIVHFIDEENIVTCEVLDFGITFYTETPTKIRQIIRERMYNSRSCEKSKSIPSNGQHNCFFLLEALFW